MRFEWFFIWTNMNPLHPRMLCAKFVWNWPNGSGEEDFQISSMYFRYFVITGISPWKRVGPFIWTNLNPHHPRGHCAKFGWNWSSGSGEEDFWILSVYFPYFVIISPWEKVGPFIWINLNPPHPRRHCAKSGWNWPRGSGEGDENVKSLRQRQQWRRTTDKFWSENLTWAFSWGELKRTENCINAHSALLQKFCVLFLVDTSNNLKNIR